MGILDSINSPADLKRLSADQLDELAAEIRTFLIHKVSATGGHLGPNLGVVELTIAMHRVFDSPTDPLIFDTGHQSYVHKILTGRRDLFDTLRQKDGLSGYPERSESPHDWTESSHASAALSYADGLAKAFEQTGQTHRHVVALVGDGALTGGMCWEALNNIAAARDRNVVIIVNDNGRSYSPTIGGLAENLAALRLQPVYDKVMDGGKNALGRMGWIGERTFQVMHGLKAGVRHSVLPTEMFPDLGLKYIGPVDGHDNRQVENALRYAKDYGGPVIVHTVTQKGKGFDPAEKNEADQMHATGVIDPVTGKSIGTKEEGARSWTNVFSSKLIDLAGKDDSLVAITAAMAGPTGLAHFAEHYPNRTYDVGIAEQHAMTSAAGLALGGMHPVVAVYSTFLNRAFDQMLMDVALLKLGVTIVLDRAGVTGSDGPSHNGMWDMSIASIVPGIRIAAPRDGQRLEEALERCTAIHDAPTVVRFPKGNIPLPLEAVESTQDYDVLYRSDAADHTKTDAHGARPKVVVVNYGALTPQACAAAHAAEDAGWDAEVIDPTWVIPVADGIVDALRGADLVVTVEDNGIQSGAGAHLSTVLNQAGVDVPVRHIAIPQEFLSHASRTEVLDEIGMSVEKVTQRVAAWVEALSS
ncbi:1-deoxy-D-xylulose-5-phosphate synthase [Corynebacterium sp. 320]|uniref:1-deoxy-D-xylulose-5-phosphate synthase n=1 Tax=Corynebacterium TaxID=1716 RepID=UPI00125CC2D7|nr:MULTISPECIES: 1-deoxy-D-xylulose-5-phosphate synthase [Corynebacterium]KAB1503739.1 1-deoxy-D-xylulose-5-phosphate synthase [Corynebacterium sp. 320]KAB1553161.1 1-deoxy-D-xylulose-5-phosphate synthase [Corynebacterium sp. 321]KAB1553621.1 1-deoxy-D-xylulose-5-phosphate synthase [Corynebacterium sp. 319]KAB3527875.1 1-deoxy-D-xylulose-5-phosphate synthase [Corynebacterium sp. 250]KAB3540636.1 1-deoxy-D-xylulose-5-phosphate synthase [Corynebacterium sp. 366]